MYQPCRGSAASGAVSYTHLDVYKRQSLIKPSLRSISQKITISTAGRTKHSSTMAAQSIGVMAVLAPAAMSLDVYKRQVQYVGAGKGFLLGFLLGGGLTEEIHAHLQARILQGKETG